MAAHDQTVTENKIKTECLTLYVDGAEKERKK